MRSKITTVAIALALVGAFVAPASAAQAASATVSGTVEYKGKPVAGILVGWFKPGTGSYRSVTSGADGSYSLTLPSAGQKYVLFGNLDMEKAKQSRGNKSYVGVFYGDGDVRDYAYQTVDTYTASTAADDVDIELAKPGSIFGYDSKLDNEDISLLTLGGTLVDEVDSDGGVSFSNLVPGQYRLESSAYRFDIPETVLAVLPGERTTFTPNAYSGAVISGVVTGPGGVPAKGVAVRARQSDSAEDLGLAAEDVTDSKGRYTLVHLHDASYDISFGETGATSDPTSGDRGFVPETQVVSVVTPESKITLDEQLATGGRIRGAFPSSSSRSTHTVTLVDGTGTNIDSSSGIIGKGAFTIGSLPTGKYTAYFTTATGTKYAKKSFSVTAGKTVDLGTIVRDRKGFDITGTVDGATGYAGNPHVGVIATNRNGGPRYSSMLTSTGGYSLSGVPAGTYTVMVLYPGRENRTQRVTLTGDRVKYLRYGERFGTTSATFTANGLRVPSIDLEIGRLGDSSYGGTFTGGSWSMTAPEGTYRSVIRLTTTSVFQAKSPHWVALPEDFLPVTVTSGTKKNRGTVPLVIH